VTICPICGSIAVPLMDAVDENHRVSFQVFTYAECSECRTIFLTNPPADLGAYYETGYYRIPNLNRLAAMAGKEHDKVEVVDHFAKGRRLLEIGPGYGTFAFGAKQAGYRVNVIEMDERCCTFLRDVVDVGVTRSDAPHQAIQSLPPHDVIALWHVIEHLPKVPAMIEAAAKNLAPGGILLIGAPNPKAWQFEVMGRRWPHLDAPRHVALIPSTALKGLGAKHGLESIFVTTDDPQARGWNRFGWQRLLMNRFRGRVMQRAMFVLGYAISIAMAPFDRRPLRGASYTMVLRKPFA
jgi:hypothetical protein